MSKKVALVTGAAGFIGGHLVNYLKKKNYYVIGIDKKDPEFRPPNYDEFHGYDLRDQVEAYWAFNYFNDRRMKIDEVYALAADMGGMGYISRHHSEILYNNMLINLNTIEEARRAEVKKYFYSSSACIYPDYKQMETNLVPLKEVDAYPAQPADAYGWEKLITELLCQYYSADYGMKTYIARFHNIFGPYGTWFGGREKAPAAICRKVAQAKLWNMDDIEIWGDGEQTRSFCYIDDLVEGIYTLIQSDHTSQPFNLGQDRMVSINQLADIVMDIAGVQLEKKHIRGPMGVRGRNSDNTLTKELLGWEYKISLEEGLQKTYSWIEEQVKNGMYRD